MALTDTHWRGARAQAVCTDCIKSTHTIASVQTTKQSPNWCFSVVPSPLLAETCATFFLSGQDSLNGPSKHNGTLTWPNNSRPVQRVFYYNYGRGWCDPLGSDYTWPHTISHFAPRRAPRADLDTDLSTDTKSLSYEQCIYSVVLVGPLAL